VFVSMCRARMATREYFPDRWRTALRQRTRWITGIALQGWKQFGWRGSLREVYWLWRDRKGLIGNPLSMVANVVFFYGLATAMWSRVTPAMARLAAVTLALQVLRTGIRMACSWRIYGFTFALGVPVRTVYANLLNSAAAFQAVAQYTWARIRGERIKWLKTDHAYPTRAALLKHKRRLGDILVACGYLAADALTEALETMPEQVRLGEHLLAHGLVTEEELYEGLSFQHGLPRARIEPDEVEPGIARALPERAARDWKVLPFQVAEGSLFVAGPEIPGAELSEALRDFTTLEVRFHLVTPEEYRALADALL